MYTCKHTATGRRLNLHTGRMSQGPHMTTHQPGQVLHGVAAAERGQLLPSEYWDARLRLLALLLCYCSRPGRMLGPMGPVLQNAADHQVPGDGIWWPHTWHPIGHNCAVATVCRHACGAAGIIPSAGIRCYCCS